MFCYCWRGTVWWGERRDGWKVDIQEEFQVLPGRAFSGNFTQLKLNIMRGRKLPRLVRKALPIFISHLPLRSSHANQYSTSTRFHEIALTRECTWMSHFTGFTHLCTKFHINDICSFKKWWYKVLFNVCPSSRPWVESCYDYHLLRYYSNGPSNQDDSREALAVGVFLDVKHASLFWIDIRKQSIITRRICDGDSAPSSTSNHDWTPK